MFGLQRHGSGSIFKNAVRAAAVTYQRSSNTTCVQAVTNTQVLQETCYIVYSVLCAGLHMLRNIMCMQHLHYDDFSISCIVINI